MLTVFSGLTDVSLSSSGSGNAELTMAANSMDTANRPANTATARCACGIVACLTATAAADATSRTARSAGSSQCQGVMSISLDSDSERYAPGSSLN
jgi:hypothetical protein